MASSADTELLRAKVRLELDKAGISDAKAGLALMYHALQSARKEAEMTVDAIDSINEATTFAAETAESFLQPWKEASSLFVQTMGFADQTSARWLKTQQRLTQSQLELGRVATRALQPWQDKLANILGMIADFATKHPQLVEYGINAAAIVAAGATALNAATRAAASIRETYSYIKALGKIGGLGAGLGAAGVLAVGLPAAVGIGSMAGKGIGQGLAKTGVISESENLKIQAETFGSVIRNMIFLWDSAVDPLRRAFFGIFEVLSDVKEEFKKIIIGIREWIGSNPVLNAALPGAGLAADQAKNELATAHQVNEDYKKAIQDALQKRFEMDILEAKKIGDFVDAATGAINASNAGGSGGGMTFSQDMLDNFAQFIQQLEQQEKQFLAERQRAIEAFNRQMAEAEADFREQQLLGEQEFLRASREAENSFHEEQKQSRVEFYRNEQKATEDFLLAQVRARQDHEYRLQDAAARLDALGVIQEQRQYSIDKQRAEEDFQRTRNQAKAEFKVQEKQREDNFKKQQAQAADQFRRQQTAAEQQFRKQQERERQHFNQQLADQAASYNAQRQMAIDQYRTQMNLQLQYQNWSESQIASYYGRLQAQLQAFIAGAQVPETVLDWDGGQGDGGGNNTGGNSGPGGLGPGDDGYDPRKDPELRREWRMEVQAGEFTGTFEQWLRQNGFTWPGMAGGGSTGQGGLRMTHPHEFMLTASTTSSLEQSLGGRLTQGGIAKLGRSGGGGGMNVTNVFNDVGKHSIGDLEGMVERVMTKLIKNYVGSAG